MEQWYNKKIEFNRDENNKMFINMITDNYIACYQNYDLFMSQFVFVSLRT